MVAIYIVVNFIIYNLVQTFVYWLLYNIFKSPEGWNLVTHVTYINSSEGEAVTSNVANFMTNGFIYNLFGLVVALVGAFVLKAQGAFGNVAEKLLEDKRLAEEIRKNDEEFSIPDIDEDLEEENKSEINHDESKNQQKESSDTIDSK